MESPCTARRRQITLSKALLEQQARLIGICRHRPCNRSETNLQHVATRKDPAVDRETVWELIGGAEPKFRHLGKEVFFSCKAPSHPGAGSA